MNTLVELRADCLAEGKAKGRAEVILAVAEQLFYEVPEPSACSGVRLLGREEAAVNTLVELCANSLAEGKAKGRAEVFLAIAEQQFHEVPEHLKACVHNASAKQIHEWIEEMWYAPDLESLINGSEVAHGESSMAGSHEETGGMGDSVKSIIWTNMWMANLVRDYTEMFLEMAKQQFGEIPEHLAARVHNKPIEQIHAWLRRLPNAPDFESVINQTEIEETETNRLNWKLESVHKIKYRQNLHRAKRMRRSAETPD